VDLLTKHLCPRIELHMQAELRPILLRRMKEDVENLPEKEEVVVRVQLTAQQRHFYKAIFAKQAGPLLYVFMAVFEAGSAYAAVAV
jgi:SNF2 family DNA or RNA helicase